MTSPLEFSARAALCRQLARREPDSKVLWLAEAERWSRLTLASRVGGTTPEYTDAYIGDAFEAFPSEISPEAANAS